MQTKRLVILADRSLGTFLSVRLVVCQSNVEITKLQPGAEGKRAGGAEVRRSRSAEEQRGKGSKRSRLPRLLYSSAPPLLRIAAPLVCDFRGSFGSRLFCEESGDLSAQVPGCRRIIVALNYDCVTSIPTDPNVRVDSGCAAAVTSDALTFDSLIHETVAVFRADRRIHFAAGQLLGSFGVNQ